MECKSETCDNEVDVDAVPRRARLYCSNPCRRRQNQRLLDRRTRYGVHGSSADDYDRLFAEQNGRCAICGTTSSGASNNVRFAFDHDHKTNQPRGLLCYPCNVGLGSFRDNPEFLQSAIRYLSNPAPVGH